MDTHTYNEQLPAVNPYCEHQWQIVGESKVSPDGLTRYVLTACLGCKGFLFVDLHQVRP
jgi:hypothetical protein